MKFRWDSRYLRLGVTAFAVVAASMLFYYGIFHMGTLILGIRYFMGIMAPIIYGIAIAFLMSPIVNFLEQKVIYPVFHKKKITLQKKGQKVVRWICVILCVCFLFFIIYALVMMILPELIRSIMNFIYSFPDYVNAVRKFLDSIVEKGWDLDGNTFDILNQSSQKAQNYLTTTILPQMQGMLKNVSAGFFDILTFLKNFIIGAIVSLYLMADKEKFVAKGKMITYGLFPLKQADFIIRSMRFTSKTFIGFITGKILDSAIIGVLCYIGTTLLDMPYATLVSVVVGVTNVIPFFGPYLGAIPCILLILLVDPIKALYFAIFILVLQQFDGNILGPKILGDSTGLSSFMVIVAILIGGGLFGIPGMIIGVPVFAVLYAAWEKFLFHLLARKDFPRDENTYMNIDRLNPETKEPVQFPEKPAKPKKTQAKRRGPSSRFWDIVWEDLVKIWKLLCAVIKIVYAKIYCTCVSVKRRITKWYQGMKKNRR